MMLIRTLPALLLVLAMAARPANGSAQTPGPAADSALEAATRELASQIRCVQCQGLSIQDSPSELSKEMKQIIREQLAAGRTPEEVKAYFVARYGEWILLDPPARGLNLAVYILPILSLLGGAVVVVVLVRRWTRPLGDAGAPDAGAGP
ncbi:MAG TPA: cytochrome c-type biogenesis protein CcmH [Longimicrobiales bacterium]